MQTYTHFVITEFLNRKIRSIQAADKIVDNSADSSMAGYDLPPIAEAASRIGSIAPDAPLTLTFLVFLGMDMIAGAPLPKPPQGEPASGGSSSADSGEARSPSRVGYLFGTLFFKDWRMKLIHNLFHAPLLTLAYTLLGYWGWKRQKPWGANLFWFGASCMLHTAIDIPLHYDDGPLLLFPLDWQTRYYSPVSYWDSKRYGRQFTIFEHLLLIGLIIWLVRDWWKTK